MKPFFAPHEASALRRGRPTSLARALVLALVACACGQVDLTFVPAGEAGVPDASTDGNALCVGEAGDANHDGCFEPGLGATCDGACASEDAGLDANGGDDDASFDAADDAPVDEGPQGGDDAGQDAEADGDAG